MQLFSIQKARVMYVVCTMYALCAVFMEMKIEKLSNKRDKKTCYKRIRVLLIGILFVHSKAQKKRRENMWLA